MTTHGSKLPRITLWCLALLASAPLFAAQAAQVETAPFDAAIRELGRAWLVDNSGVGLSIGVYENGKRHFYNFGVIQNDGNKLPTQDTVYEIGTLTKVF